jgi:hypothetical protein
VRVFRNAHLQKQGTDVPRSPLGDGDSRGVSNNPQLDDNPQIDEWQSNSIEPKRKVQCELASVDHLDRVAAPAGERFQGKELG